VNNSCYSIATGDDVQFMSQLEGIATGDDVHFMLRLEGIVEGLDENIRNNEAVKNLSQKRDVHTVKLWKLTWSTKRVLMRVS
jgi:hypothetical protein